MTQWYYADRGQTPRGPVDAAGLAAQLRAGNLAAEGLVWRDGMTQWEPLSRHADALGLGALAPAPLPRKKLSGCLIAVIVSAVCLIPALGILAAIAIPAYQDYTLRAKASSALVVAAPLKPLIVEFLRREGECPDNDSRGFRPPTAYASVNVASIELGAFDESEHCGMELKLRGTGNDKLDDKEVWLEYDAGKQAWICSSEIDDKYLPPDCRG